MDITGPPIPWLLMVFTLPSAKASERVQVWRRLQKFGCVAFRNAGYLLPNTPENRERLIWVSEIVRSSQGEASVVEIASVDDLSVTAIRDLFRRARDADYASLEKELKNLKRGSAPASLRLVRLRKRFEEVVAMDFFAAKQRASVQAWFDQLSPSQGKEKPVQFSSKKDYQHKTWLTRPHPGIDRVSSAWLIARHIDAQPKFVFAGNSDAHPGAVPFDMFGTEGFGHEGNHCTFETLCHSFGIKDKKTRSIAEAVHDADLEDGKFGREEGHVINRILQGWAKQKVDDHELLKRGMDLIAGLYVSIAG
jgi:hypothetical protein